MSAILEIVAHWSAHFIARPEIHQSINGTIELCIKNVGSWKFSSAPEPRVVEDTGPADCTISLTEETAVEIAQGEITAQAAFLSERMQVYGDPHLALFAHKIFSAHVDSSS